MSLLFVLVFCGCVPGDELSFETLIPLMNERHYCNSNENKEPIKHGLKRDTGATIVLQITYVNPSANGGFSFPVALASGWI